MNIIADFKPEEHDLNDWLETTEKIIQNYNYREEKDYQNMRNKIVDCLINPWSQIQGDYDAEQHRKTTLLKFLDVLHEKIMKHITHVKELHDEKYPF